MAFVNDASDLGFDSDAQAFNATSDPQVDLSKVGMSTPIGASSMVNFSELAQSMIKMQQTLDRSLAQLPNQIRETVVQVLNEEERLSLTDKEEGDLLDDEQRDLSAHSSSKGDASAPMEIDGDASAPKRQKRDTSAHSEVGDRLNALFDSNAASKPGPSVSVDPKVPETDPEGFLQSLKAEMAMDKGAGEPIRQELADLIKIVYTDKSADNAEISSIIKKNPVPENLPVIRTPKLNPEVANSKSFTKNNDFVLSNEHAFYSSSNMSCFAISILSKLANDAYVATLDGGAPLDPKKVVKECLSAITLIGTTAAETAQKRGNNIRKLCADEYKGLCGPAPGSAAAKKRPQNKGSEYLLGDDLKSASKEAKRGSDICKKPSSSTETARKPQDFRRGNQKFGRYKQANNNSWKSRNSYSGYNNRQGSNQSSGYNNNNHRNNSQSHNNNQNKRPREKLHQD